LKKKEIKGGGGKPEEFFLFIKFKTDAKGGKIMTARVFKG
jgi:hypothetical protein